MQSDKLHHFTWKLAALVAVVFSFFLINSYINYRFDTNDDFQLYFRLKEQGFLDSLLYWKYNVRPISFLLFNGICSISSSVEDVHYFVCAYFLLSYFLMVYGIYKLTGVYFQLKKEQRLTISILAFAGLYFMMFQSNEIFFWFICHLVYMLPLLFVVWAWYFLKNGTQLGKLWAVLLFGLTGGCYEPFSALVIFFLIFHVVFFEKKNALLYVPAILMILFFYGFNILGNNYHERVILEESQSILYGQWNLTNFMSLFNIKRICIAFGLQFLIAALLIQKGHPQSIQRKIFIFWILLLLSSFFLSFGAIFIVFRSIGPARTWFPFGVSLYLFSFFFVYCLRHCLSNYKILLALLTSTLLLILVATMSYKQFWIGSRYSAMYDERITQVKKSTSDTIYVSPISDPGVLITSYSLIHLKRISGGKEVLFNKENDDKGISPEKFSSPLRK